MPKLNQMFPSKYLAGTDLEGRPFTLKIKGLKKELIGQEGEQEEKWVIYFHGTDKGMVLNKTNGVTIAKLYGEDTDGWLGKRITIFPQDGVWFGKPQTALRVMSRVMEPSQGKAPAFAEEEFAPAPPIRFEGADDDDDDDDIPF